MNERTRRVVRVLQYGIAILALWWLFTRVDLSLVRSVLDSITPGTLLVLIVLSIIGLILRFALWAVLIDTDTNQRYRRAAYVDLTVNLVNQFFPSRVTGRAAAPLVLRQWFPLTWDKATAIAALNTALYSAGYGLTTVIGLVALGGYVPWEILSVIGLAAFLYLAVGAFILLAGTRIRGAQQLAAVLGTLVEAVPFADVSGDAVQTRMTGFASQTGDSFRAIISDWSIIGAYGAILVIVLLIPGIRVALLLVDLGAGIEPIVMVPLYLVAAYSVTVLPLTPGGIGISEVSAAIVFVALGAPAAVIVPVIILDRILGVYGPAFLGIYPAMKVNLAVESI